MASRIAVAPFVFIGVEGVGVCFGHDLQVDIGWFKKIKSVQIYSASILCGALLHKDYRNIFIFSHKWVLRVSQGGSILKKVDFQDV